MGMGDDSAVQLMTLAPVIVMATFAKADRPGCWSVMVRNRRWGPPARMFALECRGREGYGGARCPEYVAGQPRPGHDHGEIGGRERPIDEEHPDAGRGSVEGQGTGLGDGVEAVDAGRKGQAGQVARVALQVADSSWSVA